MIIKYKILETKTYYFKPKEPTGKDTKSLEKKINEDKINPQKKKHQNVRLLKFKKAKGIRMALEKDHLAPRRYDVDGISILRSSTYGNLSMEVLVRLNFGKLAMAAIRVGMNAIKENDDRLLMNLCLDPIYGITRTDFTSSKGLPLSANGRAAYEMIKQFFKDEPMAEKLQKHIKEKSKGVNIEITNLQEKDGNVRMDLKIAKQN